MLLVIICILIIVYRKTSQLNQKAFGIIKLPIRKMAIVLGIMFLLPAFSKAQQRDLVYTIKRNGSKVGSMKISEICEGGKTTYKLLSEVSLGFILRFRAKSQEEAIYKNGIMSYSFVYQKINGSEKINKQTKQVGTNYIITVNGKDERFESLPIRYNMVRLYTHEPSNVLQIFSDKFQQNLNLQKTGIHQYRICFPDGNSNDYYYQDDVCTRIIINHTFYSAIIELN
jgi:hypothetical protein